MNTDGASDEAGFAGAGGILRDEEGSFLGAYATYLHRNGNNMAELLAIREGLQLAHRLKIYNLIVDSDSSCIIDLCNRCVHAPWFFVSVLRDIHLLASNFSSIVFCHQYREANNVADCLVKKAAKEKCNEIWVQCPSFLYPLLYSEKK